MLLTVTKVRTGSRKARRADIAFSAAVLIVGTTFVVQAWKLPPSRFDPLGPGSFPIAISALLVVLSAVGLVLSLAGRSLGAAETSMILGVGEAGPGRRRPGLALLVLLLTAAYAALLQWTALGFFWATAIFIFAGSFAMSSRSPKTAAIALAVALGVSGALTLLFGRLLGFPLP